jgi:hypothetical protein
MVEYFCIHLSPPMCTREVASELAYKAQGQISLMILRASSVLSLQLWYNRPVSVVSMWSTLSSSVVGVVVTRD